MEFRRHRVALLAEWLALFVGAPAVIYAEIMPASKIVLLAPPVIYAVAVWYAKGGQDIPLQKPVPQQAWTLKTVLVRFVVLAPVALLLTWLFVPQWLFAFPHQAPGTWAMVMVAYPFVSALPQEFVYRRYYFWRYQPLFGTERNLAWTSAVIFGAMHVIYDNPYTVVLATFGGALFTFTWLRSRRLWLTTLEHALYGNLIFTIGIGRLFYEPSPVG